MTCMGIPKERIPLQANLSARAAKVSFISTFAKPILPTFGAYQKRLPPWQRLERKQDHPAFGAAPPTGFNRLSSVVVNCWPSAAGSL